MAAFSTTDEAVLTAPLELNPLAQSATASSSGRSIYYVYDILSTAAKIHNGRFQRVALQFPDEALVDSVPVYWALKKEVRELYSANSTASESASPSASTSASSKASSGLPEFYILADTSYGGCCVDEVAAKHVDADLVVHYGHACLSATARLPVIYVFTKQPLADVAAAAKALAQKAKEHICNGDAEDIRVLVLTYDVSWDHVVDDLFQATKLALAEQGIELPLVRTHVDVRRNYDDKLVNGKSTASDQVAPAGCCGGQSGACGAGGSTSTSSCCGGGACSSSNPRSSCAKATSTASSAPAATPTSIDPASERAANPLGSCRRVTLPPSTTFSQCGYLYLGPESLSLTNLLLTLGASTPLISFDPLSSTARVETGSTNRLLMKRYASVLKARDASVVGLLVGTLGVHSYLPLLRYLRSLLTGKRSGRKVYTISVGKLNPAKLANFQEIDVFVLVACPENTLVDSKEFFRPIVTPFEMELAVRAAERQQRGEEGVDWSGKYVLDLEKLVPAEYSREDADGDLLAKTETQLSLNPAQDADEEENDDGEEEDDRPHFSLISGTYVHRRKFNHRRTNPAQLDPAQPGEQTLELSQSTSGAGTGTNGDKVVVRNATTGELTTVLESASMAHLSQRSWKGLEQRLGLDEPSVLEEGREGIAKGYKDAGGQGHIM